MYGYKPNKYTALVDARRRTTVTQDASAYDTRATSCSPSGCSADLTRDRDTSDGSRWSCREDLQGEPCTITYEFEEPQDIVEVSIALFRGDERVRKLQVTASDGFSQELESSGSDDGFERFVVNTDETAWMTMESVGLDSNEWISIEEASARSVSLF